MAEVKARTLNEEQQRQSLSGFQNAKGLGRSIRNVLAKPYKVFWPLVDSESEDELLTLLETLLPAARKVLTLENRHDLRRLQGKKMKEARAAVSQAIWENNPGSKELRSCLLLGVNDVSRGLETGTIASVLISNDADPPMLTQHLSTLAVTRSVPLIVLQNLKKSTLKALDFSCLAVGFKRIVAEDEENHFHPIHMKIENEFRKLALKGVSEKPSTLTLLVDENNRTQPPKAPPSYRNPQNLYLTRTSKNYRTFVPEQGIREDSGAKWSPYISLSSEDKDFKQQMPLSRSSFEILGSQGSSDSRSFLQKVRDAKKTVPLTSSETKETGAFLSLESEGGAEEDEAKPVQETLTKVKPVKRYFSLLQPLKIKRIQGNPQKVKKKLKGKQKKGL